MRTTPLVVSFLILSAACADQPEPEPGEATASLEAVETSNTSGFNGTAIAGGRHVWFSSVVKVSGLDAGPARVFFDRSHVVFDAAGVHHDVAVPGGVLIIDPAATVATTSFDGERWTTVIPRSVAGKNMFLTGLAFPVPAGGLPGGVKPVAWRGVFTSDTPGLKVSWQWAAAVYTTFATDGALLGVKPTDDNQASTYANSDHAGTPEVFKPFVTGGARGGGGSNYTGSLSGTVAVYPPLGDPCGGGGCTRTLTVLVAGGLFPDGATCATVTSAPAGISCTQTGGTCQATFPAGSVVILEGTVVQRTGLEQFNVWDGDVDCAGSPDPSCSITMDADRAVLALFTCSNT